MGRASNLVDRAPDSEKITLNLGYVDLGRIDVLVREGFYANRSDLIRTAIRRQLDTEAASVMEAIARNTMELGLRDYTSADLEAVRAAGEVLHVRIVGLARIAPDVDPDLARAVFASISVLGALQCSPEVRVALKDRMK